MKKTYTQNLQVKPNQIGWDKAKKFAAVEGMTLSQSSLRLLAEAKANGLSGDKLRQEILKSFLKTNKS